MSERFESVLTFDDNIWCKSSPVLIEKGVLLKDTYSNKFLIQLKFMNISSNSIVGLNLRIACRSKLDNTYMNLDFSYTDFDAEKGNYFGDRIPLYIPNSNLREFDFIVTKVIFKNGKQWENKEIFYPIPKESTDINVLGDLKEQFKRDIWDIYKKEQKRIVTQTVYMPVFKNDYWLCTCGAFNLSEENECCKCGISKKSLSEAVKIENIKENQNLYNLKMQEKIKQTNEIIRKRTRKVLIALIILAVIVILNFVGKTAISLLNKSNNYKTAIELYKNDEYSQAYDLFFSLDGYKDSEQYLYNIKIKIDELIFRLNGNWYNKNDTNKQMTIDVSSNSDFEYIIYIRFNDGLIFNKNFIEHFGNNNSLKLIQFKTGHYDVKLDLENLKEDEIEINISGRVYTYCKK